MQRVFRQVPIALAVLLFAFVSNRTGGRSLRSSVFVRPSADSVHVPLEDVGDLRIYDKNVDAVRQVLRIIDLQHVEPERLNPIEMLSSGISSLSREFGGDIEFSLVTPVVSERNIEALSAELCVNKKDSSKFQFCRSAESKNLRATHGHDKSVKTTNRSPFSLFGSQQDDVYSGLVPAVRVFNRVFHSTLSARSGLRFVDSLSRPALATFALRKNLPIEKVVHVFLNGMLRELDPHSSYLSADEYHELRRGTRGQFGGVGLVFDEIQSLPIVREIVPLSPAQLSGVKAGDILLRIGTTKVAFVPLESVIHEVRKTTSEGPTPAWFYRPKEERVIKVTLTRDVIPTASVEVRAIPERPDVLHVRLAGFSSRSARELSDAIQNVLKQSNRRVNLLLLDLRGNPGGLLDQAVQVADLFVKRGKIVSTKTRYDEQIEYATPGRKIDLPTVVLVNSSSASASEIVAGALRDQNQALVVGERTFGKGSVQSLFELDDSTSLKLTMAHYFTPSGKSIQSLGVEPHLYVRLLKPKGDALWMSGNSETEREEDLAFHLENPEHDALFSGESLNFGDSKTPSLWAMSAPSVVDVPALEHIDFSYPGGETATQSNSIVEDPFMRAAIGAADELLATYGQLRVDAESVRPILERLQKREISLIQNSLDHSGSSLTAVSKSFFDGFDIPAVSFTEIGVPAVSEKSLVTEPVKPVIANIQKLFSHLSFAAQNPFDCCEIDDYTFELDKNAIADETRVSGYVGMRLENAKENPVVWTATNIAQQKNGRWRAHFKMPRLFRSYVSLQSSEGPTSVGFYLKESIDKPGAYVGRLRVNPAPNTLRDAPIIHLDRISEGEKSRSHTYQIKVEMQLTNPNPNLNYTFHLIDLTDHSVRLDSPIVTLRQVSTGSFVGEFKTSLLAARGQLGFRGVLGAILEASSGEVLGKWPLLSIDQNELHPVETRQKQASIRKFDDQFNESDESRE